MSDSLDNFNGHLEAKKGQKMAFSWSIGFNFGQFSKSTCPIYFNFYIEKIIISDPRSYLNRI